VIKGKMKLVILAFVVLFAAVALSIGCASADTSFVPDNHTKIQWAVDNATAGETIIIRDGTYEENVVLNKQLTIRSEYGSTNCIVQARNTDDAVFAVTKDANIIGLTIRGSDKYGIHTVGSNLYADSVTIKENGDYGIYFDKGKEFTLTNSTIMNNGGGVTFSEHAKGNAVVENNVIRNNVAGHGLYIRLAQTKHATITNNLIDSNSETGLGCAIQNGVGGEATIKDNVIRNSGSQGVHIYGVKNAIITNMTIDGAAGDGLWLKSCSNITIKEPFTIQNAGGYGYYVSDSDLYAESVTIKDNSNYGIYFDNGNDFTLKNCTIENNGGGLTFYGYAKGNAVAENNVIRNNSGYGLNIQLAQAKSAAITNNLIDRNSETGLRCYIQNGVAGGRAVITDNVIRNNGGDGAYMHGVKDSVITNMTIYDSMGYGFHALNSEFCADGITIKENGEFGIYFESGTDFTLKNSTIENNKRGGVTFFGYAKGNAVAENNVITNNSGYGLNIQLAQGQRAAITNNLIDINSGTGLRCYVQNGVAGRAAITDNVIRNSGCYGVYIHGVKDSVITNMTIDGAAEHDGLRVDQSTNITFKESCTIQNAKRHGINASGSDFCADGITIKENGGYGIYFESGTDFTLMNSTIENNNEGGVTFSGYASGNAVAENNVIRNNLGYGLNIQLAQGQRAAITNNLIDINSGTGLRCYVQNGVAGRAAITDNVIRNSGCYGVYIHGVKDSVITNMTIDGAAEHDGLRVDQSTNITFKESCTIQNAKRHGINASDSDLYVDGVTIKENGGYGIYFDTGNDFTLMNSTIENNNEGGVTFPGYAKGNAVAENNVIRDNLGYGLNIQLLPLRRATITNNQIDSNSGTGLRCCIKAEGGKATIQDNVISNSGKFGVILNGVTDAAITNMSIDGAAENDGLYLCSCTNLTIKEPFTVQNAKRYGINASNSELCAESVTIKENGDYGIYFESGEDFILKNSTIKNNGGGVLGYASGNAVAANNVIRNNAGHGLYIQLAKAKRAEITNNWIDRNSGTGLYCYISGVGASIKENEISNSGSYGAHIYGVTGSVITRNTISNSYNLGIYLQSSSDNVIYLNNFKNDQNIYAQNSSNVWNSTQKISYTYRNTQYTSCMGNYWDGYTGNDSDDDGIGDTAYSIDSEQDSYPLMLQWEYYFASTSGFDTGTGTYPSIQGTHEGKIKPSGDIEVSKMYTYPCAGTGGHTRSIKLYEDDTLKASGNWSGYQHDWQNIAITPAVTLKKGREYRYVIETGSYPQIIHVPEYKAITGGTITCEEFTDVNGRTYDNWIPAIRLE